MGQDDGQNCRALYEQVCKQHDGITDFRGKLLALLPIASGAGIFLLSEDVLGKNGAILVDPRPYFAAAGLFGFLITVGLFIFELHGVHKCHALIEAAKKLEEELEKGLPLEIQGAFQSKPEGRGRAWWIDVPSASVIIYSAVASSWVYVATLGWTWQAGSWMYVANLESAYQTTSLEAGVLTFAALAISGSVFVRWWVPKDVKTNSGVR